MIEDPGCGHHLWWVASPDAVLIMKKFKDPEVTKKFKELCSWIIEVLYFSKNYEVYVFPAKIYINQKPVPKHAC